MGRLPRLGNGTTVHHSSPRDCHGPPPNFHNIDALSHLAKAQIDSLPCLSTRRQKSTRIFKTSELYPGVLTRTTTVWCLLVTYYL